MLTRLHIEDFALIDELDITFNDGLTVVTGETGSGKSILLGALGLALGDRAATTSVSHGAERCTVEATFKSSFVSSALNSWDLDPLPSNEIHIRRELTSSGRSKAFINDSQTSVAILKEIGSLLVDLHGQDETRALMERSTRLDLLDGFGGHNTIRDSYIAAYSGWRTALQKLSDLEAIASKPQSDVDYLQFQVEELVELELSSTDWTELEEEFITLSNATELAREFNNTFESLEELELGTAIRSLESINQFSKQASDLLERLNSSKLELQDIAEEASKLAESVHFDSNRFSFVEDKIDGLKKAMQKHRVNSSEELTALLRQLELQIESASDLEASIEKAKAQLHTEHTLMIVAGEALKSAREACGKELLSVVHEELTPLKLTEVKIDWAFSDATSPDLLGIEDVELMFSANPGAPQHPLVQIASGGEKSRIMLAFKAAIATRKTVPTIVLDEIDTGVSGDVASRMALTMKKMAHTQQVFSVTHLAQVAALGDHHIEVTKTTADSKANTSAYFLSGEECTEAIARMLSGSTITEEARAQARVLRTSNRKI
jgi:DNA repair protein RecN (Recombination protein N)